MNVTVLGGSGFIGSRLVARLESLGYPCWSPQRGDPEIFHRSLGVVFYCIGLTANFREEPFSTVNAHVAVLQEILQNSKFDQLIYLSSTRVYEGCNLAQEDIALTVNPGVPEHLYNISKLMGESIALASKRPCRIVRLSNVLGPDMGATNFVGSVLMQAQQSRAVLFKSSLLSSKDYLWIDDAVDGLIAIATRGKQTIYNLASGINTHHADLAECLQQAGVSIAVAENAPVTQFPDISIKKMKIDTGFVPSPVMPNFVKWVADLLSGNYQEKKEISK
jgi:nucleoside-diphosphate-sugar epimerase